MTMPDIQFNDANINSYEDIPSSRYPTMPGTLPANVAFNSPKAIVNGMVADGTGVFVTWDYPVGDNLQVEIAVGYQFQLLQGTFQEDDCQDVVPPGPIVFEEIVNLKTAMLPENRYIDLRSKTSGNVDVSGVMVPGTNYTARVRTLVFSEKGAGTVSGEYFKYTGFGTAQIRVDNIPAAAGLRTNGLYNPAALPAADGVTFSFTFSDNDGPSYLYRVQVGTTPGGGFSANIWDSGVIFGGAALSSRDFDIPYSGQQQLVAGVAYYWRVFVSDSMVDGGWTSANESFMINPDLQPSTVLIGTVPLGSISSPPVVANTGETVSESVSTETESGVDETARA